MDVLHGDWVFEMEDGKKKVYWIDNLPYGRLTVITR